MLLRYSEKGSMAETLFAWAVLVQPVYVFAALHGKNLLFPSSFSGKRVCCILRQARCDTVRRLSPLMNR